MKLYEYIEDFKVKCNESDFKDELKISSALSYFELLWFRGFAVILFVQLSLENF